MTIELYNNSSERNRVNKTDYISLVDTVKGYLKDATSILNPTITIESENFIKSNYAYIEEFGRYYYIDDMIILQNNLYELHLSVDVLNSYKDDVKTCLAFVERSESLSNPMLLDKKIVIEQGYNIENYEISSNVFGFPSIDNLNKSFCYAITGYLLNVKYDE